jgi:hypothetical protein
MAEEETDLNQAVAEKVLGWKRAPSLLPGDKTGDYWHDVKGTTLRPVANCNFAEDEKAAHLVVKHLRDLGWWITIEFKAGVFPNAIREPGWVVEFRDVEFTHGKAVSGEDCTAVDRDLCRAVCKAALKVAAEIELLKKLETEPRDERK